MPGDEDAEHIRLAAKLDQSDLLWCHVPNGGYRHQSVARKMKLMGLKPGVPDLLIFTEPRTAIELKRSDGKGRASAAQKQWLKALTDTGWNCYICHGADEALEVVRKVYGWVPKKRRKISPKSRS